MSDLLIPVGELPAIAGFDENGAWEIDERTGKRVARRPNPDLYEDLLIKERAELRALELRDLFLLGAAIGSPDSMKVAALTYDAVIEQLGPPGSRYDPAALYEAARECSREPWRLYREIESQGGTPALKEGGWLP